MHNVFVPADAGNSSDTSTTSMTIEERTAALLTDLSKRLRSIDVRMDILEKRLEYLDSDVLRALGTGEKPLHSEDLAAEASEEAKPLIDSQSASSAPPLALRSDGRVLLSTVDLDGVDLSAYETFTGIVLHEAQEDDLLGYLMDGFHEAAARVGGHLRRNGRKTEDRGDE